MSASLILAMALPGCGEVVSSRGIPTAEMYADLRVSHFGEGPVLVEADLKKGGADSDTYIELEHGDRMVVSLNSPLGTAGANGNLFEQLDSATVQHKAMEGGPDAYTGIPLPLVSTSFAAYHARFDTAQPGDIFFVALERAEYDDAPNSTVVLPAAFTIDAPISEATASRAADLVISWSPVDAAASVSVSATVDCLLDGDAHWESALTSDQGMATIPAGALAGGTQPCPMTIIIDRRREGVIDPHYGQGGRIHAHQKRYVKVTSAP
jgi:hypothetical protein